MRRSIPALLAFGLALLLAGPAAAGGPAQDASGARFEVRFMTGMVDHHEMAMEMGEICLDKAVHSELVSMCEDVIATQTAEREDLLTWLSTWYGVSHEPQMTPGQERQMDKLMELSGADFEVAFMESLIRHHALAVVRAERCRDQGGHASLLAMCGDIVAAQSAEISMLQTWLCDWYDRCRGRPA